MNRTTSPTRRLAGLKGSRRKDGRKVRMKERKVEQRGARETQRIDFGRNGDGRGQGAAGGGAQYECGKMKTGGMPRWYISLPRNPALLSHWYAPGPGQQCKKHGWLTSKKWITSQDIVGTDADGYPTVGKEIVHCSAAPGKQASTPIYNTQDCTRSSPS